MSWTYTDNPATVPADAVRLFVGDTDQTDPVVSDSVITWALAISGSNYLSAAARVARIIATKFAREVDQAAGDTKQMLSQRAKAFLALAAELEGQSGIGTGGGSINGSIVGPIVTGVDLGEMGSVASNPNRPPGFFPEDELDPEFAVAYYPR